MTRFLDLLMTKPSAEAIMAFRATEEEDARVHELVEKGKENLTFEERLELEAVLRDSHVIAMAKIKAYGEIKSREAA